MLPTSDPTVLSYDIETFGKLAGLPSQTCFTPRRCIFVDGVRPSDLVLCAAITLPTFDPRPSPLIPWSASLLSQLVPGPTLIFDFRHRSHIHMLARWLSHADTILGMNLPFDISFSRYYSPHLASSLSPFRHTIIDLSYINYLECELRPERSLKTLGPILSTHVYADSSLIEKLPSHSSLHAYNAEDPHNTILAISALARRILRNFSSTSKLSPLCISHYSDAIHSLTLMSESGVPLSISRARSLLSSLSAEACSLEYRALTSHSLLLSGTGSQKSLDTFLTSLITRLSSSLDYSRLTLTPKTGRVSSDESNRSYLASFLPPSDPDHIALTLITRHSRIQKLVGSYLYPMLLHKKARKSGRLNRSALLIPQPGVPHPCPIPLPSTPEPPSVPTSEPLTSREPSSVTPSPSNTKKKKKPSSSTQTPKKSSSHTKSSTSSTGSSPTSSTPTTPAFSTTTPLPDGAHPDIPGQSFLPF